MKPEEPVIQDTTVVTSLFLPIRVVALLLLSFTPLIVRADLIAYEPFGPAGGVTANLFSTTPTGVGFIDSWKLSSRNGTDGAFLRVAGPLNGWPRNIFFPTPSGGRLQYGSTATWTSLTRTLSRPVNLNGAGSYFISFLIHDYCTATAYSADANNDNRVFLGNSSSRIYLGRGYSAGGIAVGPTSSPPYQLPNATVSARWPGLNSHFLIFVVGKIDSDGAGNLTIRLKHYYFDPVAGSGDLVDTDPSRIGWDAVYRGRMSGTLDQLGISSAGTDWQELDEIRLGTAWNDVANTVAPAGTTNFGLINVALGPLPGTRQVYSGPGPVFGGSGDYWNPVSFGITNNGVTTSSPMTSPPLLDSGGALTPATLQVGTNGGGAKVWTVANNGSWGGEFGRLLVDSVLFSSPDALVLRGLNDANAYTVTCLTGPWDGQRCELTISGFTNTLVQKTSWATPLQEGRAYGVFTNVTTDGHGSITIHVGFNSNSHAQNVLSGLQVLAVPPTISEQPVSQPAPPGGRVRFSVAAVGGRAQPVFQWQQKVGSTFVDLSDNGSFSGTSTAALTISDLQATHSGSYRVQVTFGSVVLESHTADLTVQSGTLIAQPLADFSSILRNPFMGYDISPVNDEVAGTLQNADEFYRQVSTPIIPYASVVYIRCFWSQMEPQEGVYAWNSDTNFMALCQGAWNRGLRMGFRVFVNSADAGQKQATPQWVFNAGATVTAQDAGGPDPDITDPVFQQKYAAFVRAFGAAFNDPAKVAYVDASSFGSWGEMNVSDQSLNGAQLQQTMTWLMHSFTNAFTRVPLAMNFPGATWNTPQYDDWCFNTGAAAMRRDGVGSSWVDVGQEEDIRARWPGKPFISECAVSSPSAAQQAYILSQVLYLHGNYSDYTTPAFRSLFTRWGGYRFTVGSVSYPGIVQSGQTVTLSATVQNWGVGVLPNQLKAWNYKYKFAFALLDDQGNPVGTVVDTSPGDDPHYWTNGTAYAPPNAGGIPTDIFWSYDQANPKSYPLRTSGNFGAIPGGHYYMGVAVVDTSRGNSPDVSLAVASPRTAAGWSMIGPVLVESPPVIGAQPQNIIAPQGATVQFNTTVVGFPTPGIQWLRSSRLLADGLTVVGSQISGVHSNGLTIANVQPADGGPFQVTATNVLGGISVVVGQLLVSAAPTPEQAPIMTVSLQPGKGPALSFRTLAGYAYSIQRGTRMYPNPDWTTVTNIAPSFEPKGVDYHDSNSDTTGFFRIVISNSW